MQDLSKPEEFARRVLERSVVADGTLYFKTHAHSMHPNYVRPDGAVVFPHQHPLIRRLMDVVFDAASQSGASIDFLTAREVYDEFTRPRPPPPGGFALTLPVDAAAFSTPREAPSEGDAPLEHAHALNATATDLILASLAADRAAVGYYEARALHREVLAPYEMAIARALLREPRFDAIVEVGAGIAALTICLALNGARSVGVEKDADRARIARALLDRLTAMHPQLASRCKITHAAAPAALRSLAGQDSALVFTNIAGSISPADLDELIALAARFRTVVVDLSRFFEPRDRPGQAVLLDRFVHAGWGKPSPLSSASDTYWMFRKSATLDLDDD